jgi:hypothetical protein
MSDVSKIKEFDNLGPYIYKYRKCPDPCDETAMKQYISEIKASLDRLIAAAKIENPNFGKFNPPPLPIACTLP